MTNKNLKTVSLNELDAMYERGEVFQNPEAPIESDVVSWAKAKVNVRASKKSIHLRIDADVLDFFKQDGKGHLTRMNAVLRQYMEAQTSN